jgi:putative hydrolase of the HAD superfamily
MKYKAVTFDCAQTLIAVNWRVGSVISAAMARIGTPVNDEAARRYEALHIARLPEYLELNRMRSPERGKAFWRRLASDWLDGEGMPEGLLDPIERESDDIIFGPQSTVFRSIPDVDPCLRALHSAGVRLAVISNWDYSLHRALRMFGLDGYFEFALASLEEGVEKPDPELFRIALRRLNLAPNEVLHVGDDPMDDAQGAKSAGMDCVLIDRLRKLVNPPTLTIVGLEELEPYVRGS